MPEQPRNPPEPLVFARAVTLVGGGALMPGMLAEARALAPILVAADGGAERLRAAGMMPEAVIGDMDSLTNPVFWRQAVAHFIALAEQETTDFEKCLYATRAPLYLAAGFTGRRMDHGLAVLHVMLRYHDRAVVLLGEEDISALIPPGRALRIAVEPGAPVSLFPLRAVGAGRSRGLEWPVERLAMAPGRRIGTSNRAAAAEIEIAYDDPGMLLTLPRGRLGALVDALGEAAP